MSTNTSPDAGSAKHTPAIKFIREERDCPHNATPGNKKIYDFRVEIDGDHRATFRAKVYKRGYELTATVPGVYSRIYTVDQSDRKWPVNVDSKAEFLPQIETLLADGAIPSLEEIQAIKARHEQAERDKEAEKAERDRSDAIERAAPDLYAALKKAADAIEAKEKDGWSDSPEVWQQLADAKNEARAAIAKAETLETT